MTVILCPGVHSPALTKSFLTGLKQRPQKLLVFPTDRYPAYSAYHVLEFLCTHLDPYATEAILLLGFSAGVVSAVGVAPLWQGLGGKVKALIAMDGWGVPLPENLPMYRFPMYRLSHDAFTHWSSAGLGGGQESFYADPSVAHLELWRSPQTARGWQTATINAPTLPIFFGRHEARTYTTAAQFLHDLLDRHGEI